MKIKILYIISSVVLLVSCSVEKDTFTSKLYHNTTARYNSYYLSNEKIKEAELTIRNNHKENYERVLEIFPNTKNQSTSSIDPLLEEAIKKASISIQYHKNSKWVDNGYILVGKSRFYKNDLENAVITFKYVNTIADNDNDKAEALCWLARCYTYQQQYEFAMGVLNHVRKLIVNKRITELRALVESELYQKIDYTNSLATNMEIAALNSTSKFNKGRNNYIAGQLMQKIGENDKALEHYKACIRSHPVYEMEFYAKINMAQVTGFSDSKDLHKIKKYFKKLLKDLKNVDYKDKIYYEMAKFEFKQGKIPETIENLNLSVKSSTKNQNQKAYSYLMLGEIYYEKLQKYRIAASYYDSTMMFLSKAEPDYETISKRAKILKEFTTQLAIIETEDSLQNLAKMDSSALMAHIDGIIRKQEAERKRQEEAKKAAEKKKQTQQTTDNSSILDGPNNWYFYNPGNMAKGKIDFQQKWGDRELSDNWRRKNKDKFTAPEEEPEPEKTDSQANLPTDDPNAQKAVDDARIEKLKAEFYKKIPITKAQLETSNKRLENAFYALGGIYHLKLEELKAASDTYEELLKRFPEHKNKIEVYYILYLINKDINKEKSEYYKNLVLTEYPETVYAKLIIDPEYLTKNWQLNKQAEMLYDQAYKQYETGQHHQSIATCDSVQKTFPDNYFHDKIELLRIKNISKTLGVIEYQKQLEAYIVKWKNSPLKSTAESYLAECKEYITREVYGNTNTSTTAGGKNEIFDTYIDAEQYFIAFIPQNKGVVMNDVMVNLADFNSINYDKTFEVKHIIFNQDYLVLTIKSFATKKEALDYRDKIDMTQIIEKKNIDFSTFVITPENFSKLYKTKALEEYKDFFRNRYF